MDLSGAYHTYMCDISPISFPISEIVHFIPLPTVDPLGLFSPEQSILIIVKKRGKNRFCITQ